MTKKQLRQLQLEHDTYKEYIIALHGQETLNRINLEIALQEMDEANKQYLIKEALKKYNNNT